MANELQFFGDPSIQSGLTVAIDVYDHDLTLVAENLSTTEVIGEAIYYANMPNLPNGNYSVRFSDGTGIIGQGHLHWDGSKEVIIEELLSEIHKALMLDPDNPVRTERFSETISKISFDDVVINLIGPEDSDVLGTREL